MAVSDSPDISVIIPCHNHGRFLGEAIDSLLRQSHGSWEVIVVDDGSTDDSVAIAQDLIGRLGGRGRLVNQRQSGPSAARNAGARLAQGRYLLPLDADDALFPDMLERTFRVLEGDPSVAIAYTRYRYFGHRDEVLLSQPFDIDRLCFGNYIASTSLIRRAAFEQVGGYDEEMVDGYEDWELWVSIVEAGWLAKLVPEVLFGYRIHGPSRNVGADARRRALIAQIASKHPTFFTRRRRLLGLAKRLPAALLRRLLPGSA